MSDIRRALFWFRTPDQLTKETYAENADWQLLKRLEM